MTVSELKQDLYNIVSSYFSGATVAWEQQSVRVKPIIPFILIHMSTVHRGRFPIYTYDDDGFVCVIPSYVYFTCSLFTHGGKKTSGSLSYWENTAVDDMQDFCNFLLSRYADDTTTAYDITIDYNGEVRDFTTTLDNDVQYVAQQDFIVKFNLTTRGYADISDSDWTPTPSGGGTQELASIDVHRIESAVISHEGEGNDEEQ